MSAKPAQPLQYLDERLPATTDPTMFVHNLLDLTLIGQFYSVEIFVRHQDPKDPKSDLTFILRKWRKPHHSEAEAPTPR